MANTVDETAQFIEDAYQALNKAGTYLDWLLAGAPKTKPYEDMRTAAAVAYPHILNAMEPLRVARTEFKLRHG